MKNLTINLLTINCLFVVTASAFAQPSLSDVVQLPPGFKEVGEKPLLNQVPTGNPAPVSDIQPKHFIAVDPVFTGGVHSVQPTSVSNAVPNTLDKPGLINHNELLEAVQKPGDGSLAEGKVNPINSVPKSVGSGVAPVENTINAMQEINSNTVKAGQQTRDLVGDRESRSQTQSKALLTVIPPAPSATEESPPSEYPIGIDLGTTYSWESANGYGVASPSNSVDNPRIPEIQAPNGGSNSSALPESLVIPGTVELAPDYVIN